MMRRWPVLLTLLCVLAAVPTAATADPCPGAAEDSGCEARGAYGDAPPPGQAILRQPQALALDAGGNLLVGDRWSYAIQSFDGAHAPTGAWGEYGTDLGQFDAIGGLAAGADGSIYALDIDQNRIQRWVPDGAGGYRAASTWGGRGSDGRGTADFDIRFKGDVAVAPDGRIYVADTYNQRVVWFDPAGHYHGQLGQTDVAGSDATHFRYPEGVAVDWDGNLYVADDRNNRIQKFSATGALVASVGGPGDLDNPYDVGVDRDENIYVADNMHHRVVKYAAQADGVQYTLAGTWGGRGDAAGQMLTPRSIVVQPDGTNIVTDTGNGRIDTFDANGNLNSDGTFGLNGRDGGRVTGPMGLAFDGAGGLLVADALQYRVQRMGADMSSAGFFGSHGDGDEQVWLAEGAAPASDGGAWIADTGNDRIEHFDPVGNASVVGGFKAPRDIATDGFGRVLVADTGNGRVVLLDPSGAQLAAWGGLQQPSDVAPAPNGFVYVADAAAHRIVVLDQSGTVRASWDGQGTNPARPGPAGFESPTGVGVDPAGNVYVADPGAARVSKFAADGIWLASFGSRGHSPGKFWTGGPRDLAPADGSVLASDPYDNELDNFGMAPAAATPTIAPSSAWNTGATSATVGAAVDPHALGTTYWVELGLPSAYGDRRSPGSTRASGPLAVPLANLRPSRLYHFRVVAANAAGIAYGQDQVFKTQPPVQLRAAAQRLRNALAHGIALRVRAGEATRTAFALSVGRVTAGRLGLRSRSRSVVIARVSKKLPRNRWVTVHVRLTKRVAKALRRRPRRLAVDATARTASPVGAARAHLTAR